MSTTRDCARCGLTLPVSEFPPRGPKSRVCEECRGVAVVALWVAGIAARHCLMLRAVDVLLRLGYVNAARCILAGGPWPTIRDARLMQIPKQRRPA